MNIVPAYTAPEFSIEQWNDDLIHSLEEFKGKIILLDFWTYTCIHCLRMIPIIKELEKKYQDVKIISIHSSEFEFSKQLSNIKWAVKYYNVENYLTGYDINNETWVSYGNSYWPKYVLIDRNGQVRYEHAGYGRLEEFEKALNDLLEISYIKNTENRKEPLIESTNIEENEIEKIYGTHFEDVVPEICVGYSRLRKFGNNQKAKVNQDFLFVEPEKILDNQVYLLGNWKWEKEGIRPILKKNNCLNSIKIRYNSAKNVNVIVSSTDGNIAVAEIKADGKYLNKYQIGYHAKLDENKSIIEARKPILINILKTTEKEIHLIEIVPMTVNFYFYSFIFG